MVNDSLAKDLEKEANKERFNNHIMEKSEDDSDLESKLNRLKGKILFFI